MNSETVTVVAKFTPNCGGQEDTLFEELSYVAVESRKEADCRLYIMHCSLEGSPAVLLYVIWANQRALEFHHSTAHSRIHGDVRSNAGPVDGCHLVERI